MSKLDNVFAHFKRLNRRETFYKQTKLGQIMNELGWVPKPFIDDLEWAVADAMVNQTELQRNLPDVELRLDQIEPTQHRLDHEQVESFAQQGKHDGGLVFSRRGQYFLWDGHHRYFAAASRGRLMTTVKLCELPDISGRDGLTLQEFARLLGVTKREITDAMSTDDRRRYESNDTDLTPVRSKADVLHIANDEVSHAVMKLGNDPATKPLRSSISWEVRDGKSSHNVDGTFAEYISTGGKIPSGRILLYSYFALFAKERDLREVIRHEIAHAYQDFSDDLGYESQPHGKNFRKAARRVGSTEEAFHRTLAWIDPKAKVK